MHPVYSHKKDFRKYKNVYEPCILPIVKALFQKDLREAKERIKFVDGHWTYIPSQAYINKINKLNKRQYDKARKD